MCRGRRDIFFAPDMKCVSENYVAHEIVTRTIVNVQRGIKLKIWCDVAGKSDRRCIFGAALPIDLQPPSLIEIVRVTEDRFVLGARVNKAGADFVMLSPISSFDERLGIYIEVWRPIYESNRKEIGLFPQQPDLRTEDPFVGLKSTKHRHFAPIGQAQFTLKLIRIRNAFVLDLEAERKITLRFQIGSHDLAQSFCRCER